MEIDRLINQTVLHKSFGKGIIQNIDGKYLEVNFQEKNKVSRFSYPSCFYGFLSIEDEKLQSEICAVVNEWKRESGVVQREELQKQYEMTVEEIMARRKAAEEKKMKVAQRSAGIIKMRNNS